MFLVIILCVTISLICIYICTDVKYNDNDFQKFDMCIELNDIMSIEPSTKMKCSDNNSRYITNETYIDEIINCLYMNSLAYMKKEDKLPNEAPDIYMIFLDENKNIKAYLMFYDGISIL
jgi:hypothetical protein